MDKVNQYAISKILGSKMTPVKRARFGNFGLLETTAEALRARQASSPSSAATNFSYEEDRLVVQAFEGVRQGAATDAILWDRSLALAFAQRCRQLGLEASEAFLNRRLINIRKNIRRYEQHGITIAPATKKETHPSIVPQYAHIIEFALVRLRYRYGASIDDILLDPDLGEKFEHLASELAPGLPDVDLRLAPLHPENPPFREKGSRQNRRPGRGCRGEGVEQASQFGGRELRQRPVVTGPIRTEGRGAIPLHFSKRGHAAGR